MTRVRVGTSGFTLQHFYPLEISSKDRLRYYATKFSTVEINSCFYHLPTIKTLESWKSSVTEEFIFSFKVWKKITHADEGLFSEAHLHQWLERFQVFNSGKHIFLFQFPGSTKYSLQQLKKLVAVLPSTYKYSFEFRHVDWFNYDVYSLLEKHQMSVVLSDSPVNANKTRVWPMVDVESNQFSYIRFHGSEKLYFSSYSDTQLKEYAEIIKIKSNMNTAVYCYFNNDALGYAAANAVRLQKLLGE